LRNPAVTAAIVGARNAQQVEKNVGAAELQLTDEEVAEIQGGKVQEPEPVMAG
jgi:aryl-alcohol dehydrogenase-like predicted oxidoreductase